jgi:hypothetical protein
MMSPQLTEARIDREVAWLRVLAALTAMQVFNRREPPPPPLRERDNET